MNGTLIDTDYANFLACKEANNLIVDQNHFKSSNVSAKRFNLRSLKKFVSFLFECVYSIVRKKEEMFRHNLSFPINIFIKKN